MTRPRYYLVTCAGAPNYGDELITATWLRYLARHAPDADVVVDCVRPEYARAAMSVLHPRVTFTETLWMLCLAEADKEVPEAIAAVQAKVRAANRSAAVDVLAGSDVVHLVGGGLLNGLYPWATGLVAGVVAAAAESGGRSGVTGQGLCPQRPETLAPLRELMATLTVADVRDEPSARLLALDGVQATADDVFLEPAATHRADPDAPEVMVCAQSDIVPAFNGSTEAPKIVEFLLATMRLWRVPADRIGFVECFPGLDNQVHDLLKEHMPDVRFHPVAEILRDGLPLRPGQTWVSTRFHPHLVAAMAGVGGVAVSVRPDYYDVKHQSLIDQGSGWRLGTLHEIPQRPPAGGFARQTLERLRHKKMSVAETLYEL
ncbi:polysaccharide pyruvyl transferase family protein [Kibdelosporangium aridum]|uniref:polysaccharide pyruvyl transferase family protein n=1 Tax=Kibdelosporangium aridum TaxID=2030 RepID=UPI0021ADF3CD|nr:polysaccharide pyruvyl transferase family protein [Kibdelosporangium aridum]